MTVEVGKQTSLANYPKQAMKNHRSKLTMAAMACLLTVAQVGCSVHWGNKNCSSPRGISFGQKCLNACRSGSCHGSNGTYGQIVTNSGNFNSAESVVKSQAVEPAAQKQYSYEDGVQAGRNYVINYNLQSALLSSQPLPNVLKTADLGAVFESGCRDGINQAITDRKQAAAQRIRKRAQAAAAKFVNPNRTEPVEAPVSSRIENATESTLDVQNYDFAPQQTQEPSPSSQALTMDTESNSFAPQPAESFIYSRPAETELNASDDQSFRQGDPESIVESAVEESAELLFDESADIVNQDLSIEPTETLTTDYPDAVRREATSPNLVERAVEGDALGDRIDALFEESRTIENGAPHVDWQPTTPVSTEPVESVATENVDVETAIESTSVETQPVSPSGPLPGQSESQFKPYSTPSSNLQGNGLRSIAEPVSPTISQSVASSTVLDRSPAPKVASDEKALVLSATVVPFRRRSDSEPLVETDIATLKRRPGNQNEAVPTLRAMPGYKINNRIPKFSPSLKPQPKAEPTTAAPAPKSSTTSVLINTMDQQKIELDPITKLKATPYSNLNGRLLRPNSESRAIYQGQSRSSTIENEEAKIFFVPASSEK